MSATESGGAFLTEVANQSASTPISSPSRPSMLPPMAATARPPPMFGGLAQFAPSGSPSRRKLSTAEAARPRLDRTGEPANFTGFATELQSELAKYRPPRPAAESGGGAARSPYKRRGRLSPVRARSVPPTAPLTATATADAAERVSPERSPAEAARASPTKGQATHSSIEQLSTAWDAIEYLTRVNPDPQPAGDRALEADTAARFVHLNLAESREFRPYDLVVTDELHRNPEHFTMSSAGMFHTVPGEESEFFSLEEWSQNAVAFSQCCRIPFFKSYTVTKGFYFWRKCVNRQRFRRKRDTVGRQLFGHRKSFRSTHKVLLDACYDARCVQLCDIEMRRTYTLEEFRDRQTEARKAGQQLLSAAVQKIEAELVWLCDQLKQRKRESEMKEENDDKELARAIETHMSMSEVRAEQKKRARLLNEAISEAEEVGVFVRLADMIAVETEVLLATDSVVGIQTHLQRHLKEVSHGMFVVVVDMDAEKVQYSPTMPEFLDVMKEIIDEIMCIVVKAPRLAYVRQLASHIETDALQLSSVADLMQTNLAFAQSKEDVMQTVIENYERILAAGAELEQFREMYNFATVWHEKKDAYTFKKHDVRSARGLQENLRKALAWKELLAKQMRISREIGIFHMDTRALRDRLKPLVDTVVEDMKQHLFQVAGQFTSEALVEAQRTIKALKDKPRTVMDFADLLTVVKNDRSELLMKVECSDQLYATLQETGLKMTTDVSLRHDELHESMEEMQDAAGMALREVDSLNDQMCSELDRNIAFHNQELVNILKELNSSAFTNTSLPPDDVLAHLERISVQLRLAEKNLEQCIGYEAQFKDVALSDRTSLDDALKVFAYRQELWTRVQKWQDSEHGWLTADFDSLDVQTIGETVTTYLKVAHQLYKQYKEPLVLEILQEGADRYHQWMPALLDLGNPAMQRRHWKIIFEHLGVPVPTQFSLQDLVDWKIFENRTIITETSAIASGEWSLAQSLRKVEKSMAEASFSLTEYSGVPILTGVEDLYEALEENKMTMQIMRSSRFIDGVKQDVEIWERKLNLIDQVLDEWLYCQRNWRYLQNIFTVPDIQKQLPTEAADFRHVDTKWKDIMAKTANNPNVVECTTAPGVLEMFLDNRELLQTVQKSLDDYLETKRMAFARFYFLSDDELLQILSQTKEPKAVQPHLNKLFVGIRRLEFGAPQGSVLAQIDAMVSAESETVEFGKGQEVVVSKTTNVEDWLNTVQRRMVYTLRNLTRTAYYALTQLHSVAFRTTQPDDEWSEERKSWLFSYPAMCVIAVEQIVWKDEMEKCLEAINPADALEVVCNQELRKLAELTDLVSRDLPTQDLSTIEALLVISIHEREVTEEMRAKQISSTTDFNWLKQLKYCWDNESEKLSLVQARADFAYLYEYLGNSTRLVITPLTDRCYLTMTNALMMKLGGCPYGKAGTGKTETVKDLAKALARQCIVFNCSDGLDHKIMGKFFSGLAQSGAWACFDEFNRIEVDVLSVISTQCLTIQQALMADLEKFAFDGRMITLDRNYGCFVTMNPSAGGSYGGRAELPDNLKSQFRPVAMMVPDTVLIAKSMLFAQGFISSTRLAQKITQLYKLAAEQLSYQKHYDWELRAMKPVLSMAGSLKRSARNTEEDLLLIRALRQSSIPKLVGQDIVLFDALIKDLFPNVTLPDRSYGKLQEAVEAHLEKLNYIIVPGIVDKVIQLLETVKVRHGVGLVGAPGTGKSVAQEVLSAALTDLSLRDEEYNSVVRKVLNPKAISIGRLYGEYNEVSAEWTDGLVPSIVRELITDARMGATKWVTFDGPVDPFWIENMNTVLDDNKLLCLLNGERIKLPNNINMLFEVQDLKHASPATVSRCGMVYFDEQVLGWRPVVVQWLTQNLKLKKLFPAGLDALLDSTVESTLAFLRSAPGEAETPDIHWVQRFFDFLGAITSAEFVDDLIPPAPAGQGSREQEVKAEQAIVAHPDFFSMSMAFAFIWSFGAKRPRASEFESMFSAFAASLIPQFCPTFPQLEGTSTVYDYCIDYTAMRWHLWSETVPQFHYDAAALEQMVPTVDTTCAKYLMRVLVTFGNNNVLLTGQSGCAKTSIMREFRRGSDMETLSFAYVPFSARSTSTDFQPCVESKLDQRSKDLLGPPSDTKMVILVDDLSLPQPDAFATQQTTECVRQLIDSCGFYDTKGMFWKQVVETQVVAARTPHGGGHSQVCGRLLRHFHMIGLTEPGDADLLKIFGSLLSGWVESGADVTGSSVSRWLPAYAEKAAAGSIALFSAVRDKLLPTPAKCHYIFNIRDILRGFEGLRCYEMKHLLTQEEFIRLWAHEFCRVFVDGLSDREEISWFHNQVARTIEEQFEMKWNLDQFIPSHFGAFNISSSDKSYRERVTPVDDSSGTAISELSKTQMAEDLQDALYQYQLSAGPMELVLFDDVLRHLSATCRVFRQGRGNVLLLGQSGCGRRSVVKLAAYIIEAELFEIRLARGYGLSEFREDLKPLLQKAGVVKQPVVFFLTDGQIVEESFLRDVSSILETGRVPGLFSDEEMKMLCEDLKQSLPRGSLSSDARPTEQIFADNVLKHLHTAISLVPVGERYQQWMRMYPALNSWSTADWYHAWPNSALWAVAQSHLGSDEVSEDVKRNADMQATDEKDGNNALLTNVDQVCQACVGITDAVNIQLQKLPGTGLVITPKFFVELLKLFKAMLVEKETRLNTDLQRLRGGLDKLSMCNETVEQMQADLTSLQPQLEQMAEETINLMGALANDKEEADRVSALVRRDQYKVEDMTRQCEAFARAAQKDLEDAMPAFHAAVAALNTLNKGHITELKTFKDPPPLVKTTMEAICVMKFVEPSWKSAQKIMQDFNFLDSLKNYPKDDVTDETRIKLGKYINDPSFNAEAVGKVSIACKSLCMWVLAIDQYAEVNATVRPKKARLKQTQDKEAQMQAQLQEKQRELAEVTERLEKLEQDYQESLAKRDELHNQKDDAKIRIARAETLTTQLADEQTRWSKMSKKLESDRGQLVGDTLLAAAFIGYAGAFDVANRTELVKQWVSTAIALKLPVDEQFTLEYTLGNPVELREWKLQGLPQDVFSIENSLVVANTRRWPLLTDPQDQASTWIKNMEKGNGIQVIKANDPNLLRIVENSIRMGIPVLIENVGESIDPNMRSVYQKQLFSVGGRKVIRLGDVDVDYNPLFKLYLTCNLPNPSYTTDVYTTLTVVNFAVSRFDLRDQLLTMVVAHEKPELEDQKDNLILEINKGEKMLNQVEEEILDMLKSASSNILADDDLIQQLDRAKTTSNKVKSQIEQAERTSAAIDKSRGAYETIATRGSILYFAMAKLSSLSPMYQYSLGFFRDLFTHVMKSTKKGDRGGSEDLAVRLELLTDALTQTLFDKVCRGLFEKDKLLFSFVITAKILQETGEVTSHEWDFLVRGIAVHVDGEAHGGSQTEPNPCSSWLSDNTWHGLLALSTVPHMQSVTSAIRGSQQEAWRRFRSDPEMHKSPLPSRELQNSLTAFQKLLLIKTLRPDALELAVTHFVEKALGRSFIEPTNANLDGCFSDSAAHVPTVFILSPGADPTQMQLSFARKKDMEDRLDFVSLGRGQGPTAEKLIRKGCDGGRWVCLQNCHLFLQWMPRLESLVEQLPEIVDEASSFRLWLTSYPVEGFPVPVIQCSVKMANEMPRGLRANLLRTYREFSSSKFDTVVPVKRKLLFSLAFLHAALLDRCTFGSIGFNNPYEWTAADLDISISVLNQELNESTMEETLTYMIGKVYYGGRVTDAWDQRCVESLLAKFLKSGRSQHDIPFDEDGRYGCPELCESRQECIKYIMSLPIATDPSVFGLHESADVAFRTNSSAALLERIVTASQTHTVVKVDTINADNALVLELTQQILAKLGDPLVISTQDDAGDGFDALRVVLEQEVVRYNNLQNTVQQSVGQLKRAIDGRAVMTESLSAMYHAILVLRVPQQWKEAIGDASHRPLASWTTELGKRLELMREWCAYGPPMAFYLPGLVFPQGLLAGITQQYGRKNSVAIDTLRLHTQPTKIQEPDDLRWVPDIATYGGVYIYGLVLEGARWDAEAGSLKDPIADGAGVAGARFSTMPVLWCRPVILRDAHLQSTQSDTPRISTPGPSDHGDDDDRGGELPDSRLSPVTFTSAVMTGNVDGGSPYDTGDLDSEIESLTSTSPAGGASAKLATAISPAALHQSRSSSTPYNRSPTPQPPDSVVYLEPKRSFTCPVYRTAHRGADSGGYVMSCELASERKPDSWVLRGTALMCEGDAV